MPPSAAGVAHFVYSSVASADEQTGIPFFDSKWQIERHIRALRLPNSIIRPVWFMNNFTSMYRDGIISGQLQMPLRPDTPLQMIAVEDIGRIATACFDSPSEFLGSELDIAADEMTVAEIADAFGRVMGRTVDYVQQPMDELRKQMPQYVSMFEWFQQVGYSVDIATLRMRFPEMMTFETWLHWAGWDKALREAPAVRRPE